MLDGLTRWLRSVAFSVKEAFINLNRHRLMTLAAVTTICVSLTLLGSFLLTFFQLHSATQRAAQEFEMHIYCREEVTKAQLPTLESKIRAISGVASVEYISKEAAFAEHTQKLPIDMTGIPNLFNETFIVKMTDPRLGTDIAHVVRGWHNEIQEVALPEKEMQGVVQIIGFLRTLGLVTGAVVLFGALVVISNTIRLSVFNRRREIKIMQIVGAAPWFIRLPLFLEGLIHGLVGGYFASACLYGVDHSIRRLIQDVIPQLARYFVEVDMLVFSLGITLCGAVLGAVGALVSIHRYLRAI